MTYRKQYEKWLQSPMVDEATKEELRMIAEDEQEIKTRFSAMLDFGTAGLRGIMRAGINGMNIYTVRYTTQGIANLILALDENEKDGKAGVTIAYDSRHNSATYAEEAAAVLAANGIKAYLFDELRPTPELSYALRETGSIAGINITASHNPKEYNGYKVYWADGAQLPPHHADEILKQLENIDIFRDVKTMNAAEAKQTGLIQMLGEEMDEAYMEQVLSQSVAPEAVAAVADTFQIIFTPFHGAGYKLVPEVLKRLGIKKLLTVKEQMVLDGDFPTVVSPNPENKEGFALAIEMAKEKDVDLIIGTDPDADRVGTVVRNGDDYETLSGNQMGVLLLDYLITLRREHDTLPKNAAVVKSLVSTPMANAVCEKNGITIFETLTGFKYIGEKIKEFEATGEYTFLFGFEESYGYLSGTYARDKDAVVASMLIAEMACWYKAKDMTLYEAMKSLYEKYDYFKEQVISISFDGHDAPEKMKKVGEDLRRDQPTEWNLLKVLKTRDYMNSDISGMPASDVLFYELEDGCNLVVRPSGTEPKIKFYFMVRGEDEAACDKKLEGLITDVKAKLNL